MAYLLVIELFSTPKPVRAITNHIHDRLLLNCYTQGHLYIKNIVKSKIPIKHLDL